VPYRRPRETLEKALERLDILAANPLGRALFPEMFDGQEFRQHGARHDVRFHISGVKR
jgi:hypothetical protein